MRAINLVPAESRPGRVNGGKSGGAVYGVLGLLVVMLVGLSVLALAKRDAARAEQQLATIEQSTVAYTSAAAQFSSFEEAAGQASQRIATVRNLAEARFDWAGTLRDMARLIPNDTSIGSLSASVSEEAGASGGSSNPLRSALPAPAISIAGCSISQSTVANLINQLQAMRRVTNVSLSSSSKGDAGAGDGEGCAYFEFNIVVFFAPGKAKASGSVVPSTTPAATAVSATTPAATTPATTPGATP